MPGSVCANAGNTQSMVVFLHADSLIYIPMRKESEGNSIRIAFLVSSSHGGENANDIIVKRK